MTPELRAPSCSATPCSITAGAESSLSRRGFFRCTGTGLMGVALADLLAQESRAARTLPAAGGSLEQLHHPAKAKRVLQIFCPGAASHIDLWDYKPGLEKHHGEPMPGEQIVSFQGKNGNLMKSPWKFTPRGQCGKMISTLLPEVGRHVDEMAFVHSMTSRSNTHGTACVFMNTGFVREGFPSAGAWLSYGLGSMNDSLPTYVVILDVRGEPPNGKANWTNGFLPAQHQAITLSAEQAIRNLATPPGISPAEDLATRELLATLNRRHAQANPGDTELTARIAAYELAARMQIAAPQATDLGRESATIHKLYGTDDANPLKAAYARNCLLATRLLEQGVRYVSLYCAGRSSQTDGLLNWDAHKTLKTDYERHCPIFDQPTAALLTDLKRRGLLEDTLVLWTTEFGRMPTHQHDSSGRDHNPDAFTCWMMGAGIKGGASYGATDEFGRRSVENVATPHDFYATVLHLLGIDHEKLTFYHNGADRRLTDVHGHVIRDILA
ncbi:MAG TPA: DUF1501 domain-containing protein [Pirellulales bacterium]|nr:DUF1501 domain-containing protein [Pirellulales bacterium]